MKKLKKLKIFNYKTGFTLIEIIVSMGILSVIVLSLVGFLSDGVKLFEKSQKRASAIYDTQSEIEKILSGGSSQYSTATNQTVNIILLNNNKQLSVSGDLVTVQVPLDTPQAQNIIKIFKPTE